MNKQSLRFALAIVAAGLSLLAAPAPAAAAPQMDAGSAQGWFVGAGLGTVDYSEPGFSASSLDYLYVQAGWRFNRYLALDARAATNLPGDCGCDYYYNTNPFELRVRSLYGLYLRATAPLTLHWDLYALAGYASLSLDANANFSFTGATAHSTSFGLGGSWKIGNGFAADLELLPRLVQGEGWRTDALNLGFHYDY